jgi:hypothetical protein
VSPPASAVATAAFSGASAGVGVGGSAVRDPGSPAQAERTNNKEQRTIKYLAPVGNATDDLTQSRKVRKVTTRHLLSWRRPEGARGFA